MKIQPILGSLRRACDDFGMIAPGDRVAVGLSGGKDSLVLLAALAEYRRILPGFTLGAVTVDMGLGADFSALSELCGRLGVSYRIVRTDIGKVVFEERREENPCSLCSKMRRGTLCNALREDGFNVLALGHHADDLVHTFMLSLLYEGRLNALAPVSDDGELKIVRPLIYTREKNIKAAAADLPVTKNPCPADHRTKREQMRELLRELKKSIPFAADRMVSALTHPERNNLWDIRK